LISATTPDSRPKNIVEGRTAMLKASTVTPKISATLIDARIGRTVSPCAENAAAKGSACSGFVGTPVDGPPRERMRCGVIAAGGKRALIAEHDDGGFTHRQFSLEP